MSPIVAWLLLLSIYVALPVWVAVSIFRAGLRQRYLSGFPIFYALFYTFGIALIVAILNWLTDEPDPTPIGTLLWFAGGLLVLGCAIWVAGFLFGPWRTPKDEGVITGR